MIRKLIILLYLIGLSSIAVPCSFSGLEREIEFEPRSVTLGAKNARELADWFIGWRDSTAGIGSIWISAHSIKSNSYSLMLSHERMDNIAKIIKYLNKDSIPMGVSDRSRLSTNSPLIFLSDFAFIGIQPACLKTNTCCSIRVPE